MNPDSKQKIVVVLGPTASGKTSLGIKIAQALKTEIISTDAVQIFRGLDIGSAKPTAEELSEVKHAFINIKNADESYNAHEFMIDARQKIAALSRNGQLPILVGGSGFFVQTVIGDRRLADQDHPIVPPKAGIENRLYQALLIGLTMPREILYDHINRRVDLMFHQGLPQEAEKLLLPPGAFPSKKAIGYREFKDYFFGNQSLDRTKELIKQNTRHYAKRQLTFFKNQFPDIQWFDAVQTAKNSQKIIDLVKKFNQS
ncbi:MAG: tRNA (adenosine(37)-N6)-dimethylallyltransferase MiaA [Oenococcus sp.]|uniref:tRNA (adenosine(37)-N6)-dimethylallyltransferase n=1 Tax=Oenococcus sp. TaxID=1979414 RepID=UPI0039EC5EE1